ncbi:NAD(P)-binding domain-containing protein [Paenibacillus sp. P96]|uniref:NAD(P)-binding domain-containing protein n=1 Tax=Paenibacillus zeirhizosphaerae TaxID=2987519 RepID=A0ABT9FW25_9BACL|nr:NAD(P)-binding domain-containing protein [Paenibacillus sp. P96]MDP4098859.1 NAD(P)-binding domain-containing protein [Paenibacillus sp. P96]
MKENKQSKHTVHHESNPANIKRPPVTVIGLGMMGSALAQALLKEGYRTTVWNRSADKAAGLAAQGAVVAGTVAEAVAASPLIIICVLDYGAVNEILEQAGDLLDGRAIVNLTNGTPAQARQMAAWAAEQGIEYLDGGIMAVPQMIASPGALLLYSGSSKIIDTYGPALESFGSTKYLGQDPGLASLHDLALLSAMYGMFSGFFHAVAMIRSEQLQAESFTSLVVPWLQAMSASLPLMAQAVDAGDHQTKVSSLHINQTGFGHFIDACRELGISTELMTPIQELINRGVAEGYGTDGLSRLVELLQKPESV